MDKIIVIEGLGADYVSPSLPVHIDPNEVVVQCVVLSRRTEKKLKTKTTTTTKKKQ